ncbi:Mitochondrial uncoupling protein 3 [Acorus calamus]|uniref:Mitochondrial uncoupling protein 3 n=1 Tax=Acorus calamus TaxID=4465 RepID=A0AAV9E6W4_ACOCL|nr:Mitochondrial uncoupling protein 3 [Acorus calamus]
MEGGPQKLLMAAASAAAAETATFPIDLAKTRLQLHNESLTRRPTNAFRVASDLVRSEGLLSLYRGLSPALLRHLFYTPLRIVSYELLRPSSDSLASRAFAGGASGVLAQVVASPADLVKVRMQADGRRYSSAPDALMKIVRSEGLGGLWRGVVPNAQRAFLVNMGELTCYDYSKRRILNGGLCEDNLYAHTLASVASGLCSTMMSCPADVVKTRMMNQGVERVYRGSLDCLVRTVRAEGFGALWKGFFPTWARLGPWQFVFWVSYEQLRRAAGMSSF